MQKGIRWEPSIWHKFQRNAYSILRKWLAYFKVLGRKSKQLDASRGSTIVPQSHLEQVTQYPRPFPPLINNGVVQWDREGPSELKLCDSICKIHLIQQLIPQWGINEVLRGCLVSFMHMFHLLQLEGEVLEGWNVSYVWRPAHVNNCWVDCKNERRDGSYHPWYHIKEHGLRNPRKLNFNTVSLWALLYIYKMGAIIPTSQGCLQLIIITKLSVFIERKAKERLNKDLKGYN